MAVVEISTVLSVAQISSSAYDMRVLAPKICRAAKPGMFVHMKCEGFMLRRPISICDADGDILRLVIDRRGEGTKWLTERKLWDTVDILGPLGRGFDVSGENLLVVGGGIGAPPLLFAAKMATSCDAALGFQTASVCVLLEDFNEVCDTVQVATDDGSLGYHGFVTGIVKNKLEACKSGEAPRIDRVLACGPAGMLKGLAVLCAEFCVPLQVSMEGRMGCGIGACLVCACKTKGGDRSERFSHVCKDGPVFDAGEVMFE